MERRKFLGAIVAATATFLFPSDLLKSKQQPKPVLNAGELKEIAHRLQRRFHLFTLRPEQRWFKGGGTELLFTHLTLRACILPSGYFEKSGHGFVQLCMIDESIPAEARDRYDERYTWYYVGPHTRDDRPSVERIASQMEDFVEDYLKPKNERFYRPWWEQQSA
jgi:hypothetical protein